MFVIADDEGKGWWQRASETKEDLESDLREMENGIELKYMANILY